MKARVRLRTLLGALLVAIVQVATTSSTSVAGHISVHPIAGPDAIQDVVYFGAPVFGASYQAADVVQPNQMNSGRLKITVT